MAQPHTEAQDVFADKSIELTVQVILLARQLKTDPTIKSVLDQVIRSAGSIGANVSEAHGATTKKDFAHFFSIALKSANETVYWLTILSRVVPEHKKSIQHLQQKTTELRSILKASLRTMRGIA